MGRRGGIELQAAVIRDGSIGVESRPDPTPEADRVVVRVAGAGVNRADLLQRAGLYPAPAGWPEDIPGLEFAGTVESVGPAAEGLEVGDRVMGIVGGGAHATHVVTPESLCCRVPESVDLVDAGGIPEAFITAHDALSRGARVRPGERVLIHGVGSGVGTAAVQVARSMGARTIGTSRTRSKLERTKEYGLDEAVFAGDGMAERIGEVDAVIDLIGGSYLEVDVEVCARRGRIVIVGLIAGAEARLDMGAVLRKRLTIEGTVLRSRPNHEKVEATKAFEREVLPFFAEGAIRPVIEARVPVTEIERAYAMLESNETFGKVVIVPEDAAG